VSASEVLCEQTPSAELIDQLLDERAEIAAREVGLCALGAPSR